MPRKGVVSSIHSVCCLLVAILAVPPVFADGGRLPQDVREKLGEAFKLDSSSQEIDRLIYTAPSSPPEIPAEQRSTLSAMLHARPLPPLSAVRVVKHYQFSEGKAFPPAAQFPAKQLKVPVAALVNADRIRERQLAQALAVKEKMLHPKPLPRCSEAKTVSREYAGQKSKEVVIDVLVLDRKAPLEFDELFGKRTKIIQYSTRVGDALSASVANSGVTCLPYRVRIVGNTRFTHWGEPALRNYDKNPTGGGVISPLMKGKLSEYR